MLAEFLGIIMGDGNVSKYFTQITLNSISDVDYIKYVHNLAKSLFLKAHISIVPKKYENSTKIQISSKIVSDFLKSQGMIPFCKTIPEWVINNPKYYKSFLKGLFDTEGSISFKTYKSQKGISIYKQLNFRNADINLMKFVRDRLTDMGFKPTQTLKRSLYLSTHDAIARFRKVIGFGNKKLLQRSLVTDLSSYNRWRDGRVVDRGRLEIC